MEFMQIQSEDLYKAPILNKSLLTNLAALLLILVGLISPIYQHEIYSTGLFALSGSITNWLAIHMLFEKVPFLYGSGVIPNQFEDFKVGINRLIMEEFFNKENTDRFLQKKAAEVNLTPIVEKLNYSQIFKTLVNVIMESSFGPMLGMFGGVEAISTLEGPFTQKIKETLLQMVNDQKFKETFTSSIVGANSHDNGAI
ncbi:DUF445 domain-containing protein, partial [Bacteriovoracaceae bacterium]|nr:DUF445 domain-containing protein [Bacteriovoracaceae bacterium]